MDAQKMSASPVVNDDRCGTSRRIFSSGGKNAFSSWSATE